MSTLKTYSVAFVILVMLLTGCASWQSAEDLRWNDTLPPRDIFERVYAEDRHNRELQSEGEYLLWVKRFYQGSQLYRHGWNDFAPEVVTNVEDATERRELQRAIDQLGQTIAAEWSKDSDHSRISTRHLSIWGNALRDSVDTGRQQEIVEQISQDVDYLLNRRMSARDITSDRYFPEDQSDVFR